MDCTPELAAWHNVYKLQQSYVPGMPLNANVTKTIKIAINVWQNDAGEENYLESDVETLTRLELAVNYWLSQEFWSANNLPSDPIAGVPFIEDTKLRAELVGINFYQHTITPGICGTEIGDLNYLAVTTNPETEKCIQLHIVPVSTYPEEISCTLGGIGIMTKANLNAPLDSYVLGGILAHEIGHILGLNHTYASQGEVCNRGHIDFLEDVFGDGPEDQPWCLAPESDCDVCYHDGFWQCQIADPTTSCTNNMMGGTPGSGYFSPLQMGRMHRSLALEPASRFAWGYSEEPYVVSQFETWDFKIKFYQDIVIPAGRELIIKCIVEMVPEAKIIVQPGGRLTIDGGKITAAQYSDTFWGGIQVWGNSQQHQSPGNTPYYQGLLTLQNGAIIEHAREAIRVWKPGDYNSTGGVVKVRGTSTSPGATFLNCRRSLEYMAYQNFQPGDPENLQSNFGGFSYAHFEVNDEYRGGDDFSFHATLWGVDGLQFTACDMVNSQSNISLSSRLGGGIGSLDASYTVAGRCTTIQPLGVPCPPADLDRGSFTGLGHAIEARDGGSGRGFVARDLDFNNNVVGVYTNSLSQFTVVKNNFILGERNVELDGPVEGDFLQGFHRAISTEWSHGFRIEENNIGPAGDVAAAGIDGITIANSGSNNTQVYKNTASGLDNAFVGEGNCTDPLHSPYIGHQFLCNTNSSNDFNITTRLGNPVVEGQSIRTHQGTKAYAAQNTFDQDQGSPLESDVKNTTGWPCWQWHKNGTSQPQDVTDAYVIVAEATNASTCPSQLTGGGIIGGGGIITGGEALAELADRFTTAKTAYISTAYVFNSLLDGGNTDIVVTEVQTAWPADAWDLRNYLMSKSPFLSTEVLVEMVKKHVLPQAMELEICLANPEATKLENFIKWVEYEAAYPFPSYMVDLIAGSWDGESFRMQLESEMGGQHADMTFAADAMQEIYQSDTTGIPVDSMLSRWHQLPNYGARYSEVQLLLRMSDFDGARGVLNNLASNYPMKENREQEREGAIWFVGRMEDLHVDGRSVMQLDPVEVSELENFATDRFDIPSSWVKNILCFGYRICLPDPGGGEARPKALHPTKPKTPAAEHATLQVMPNPATVVATLKHDLKAPLDQAFTRVVDAAGREVARIRINTSPGQDLLDTRDLEPGMYAIELFNANTRMATERLVVQEIP